MGGYGAARLAFKYPELFAAVSLLGAGPLQLRLAPEIGPRRNAALRGRVFHAIYGGDQEVFRTQSPWYLAEQQADILRDRLKIRQVLGQYDFTLPAN